MITSTESLIYAATMLLLALAFMIKKCHDVQFGTCCKFSFNSAVEANNDTLPPLPPPTLELPFSQPERRNSREVIANAAKIIIPELIDHVMNQEGSSSNAASSNASTSVNPNHPVI